MKKGLILGLVLTMAFSLCSIQSANAAEDSATIKAAISKYKNKNYAGCISDLQMYTQKDPSSAIAWYYLGNSYMNIAMKDEAHAAFEKVIELNTVPKLTSYSIQAELCMENPDSCQYQNFTLDEIKKLKLDPVAFLQEYFTKSTQVEEKDEQTVQIENLIKGSYSNNIHPDAQEFIRQQRLKMKQNEINSNRAYLDNDKKLAQALEMLGENKNDISGFAMMIENRQKMTPEALQLMMMSNMMTNF